MSNTSKNNDEVKISKVVGNGVVKNVNKPGDGSFQAFTVQNGDTVDAVKYAPVDDDSEVGVIGGQKYDMMMVTQPDNNKAQAFIVWWANESSLQATLAEANTMVRGIGTTNQSIQRGDEIEIRTQSAENGGLDVTFDIKRGHNYVATFSFVVDGSEQPAEQPDPPKVKPDPAPPSEPAPPPPPVEPITYIADVKIIGASNPPVHYPYIGWTPVRCQLTLTTDGSATDSVDVTLRNQDPQNTGGQVTFRGNATDDPLDELTLTLTPNGAAADFYIAGKVEFTGPAGALTMVGHASTNDKDTVIEIVESDDPTNVFATTALMVRVRKNANTLTDGERDRFLAALALLNNPTQLEQRKRDGLIAQDTQEFKAIRDMHIHEAYYEAHGGPWFLPWHRAYLLDLERELQKVDPSVTLPYWRFDEPAPNIFTQAFLGTPNNSGMLQFSATNPLQFWATDGQTGIQRQPSFNTQTSSAQTSSGISVIGEQSTLNLGTNYSDFDALEGNPHGTSHMSFSGYVSDIGTAARDPLFFMLHCNVDRLWAKWQWLNQRNDANSESSYPQQPSGRAGHDPTDTMWPWNQQMGNPRPTTAPGGAFARSPIVVVPGTQPTVREMIDYQGMRSIDNCIGLHYDDVPYEHQA